jgi:hypothetical protein
MNHRKFVVQKIHPNLLNRFLMRFYRREEWEGERKEERKASPLQQ